MIGFIGGGNMAEALIKGMLRQRHANIMVAEILETRRLYLESNYKIKTTKNNQELVQACSLIILAVKPQQIDIVLNEIAPVTTEDKIVVSIAAGITLEHLCQKLPTKNIARAMPNTPAIVQEGLTALAFNEQLPQQNTASVCSLFEAVGTVITVSEKNMNTISALSGSGPAFIALFIETLIQAGIAMGLSEDETNRIALQTITGTAALLKTGMTPQQLRTMVTSPGGSTLEGLKVFEAKGLTHTVSTALQAARMRADELGRM